MVVAGVVVGLVEEVVVGTTEGIVAVEVVEGCREGEEGIGGEADEPCAVPL